MFRKKEKIINDVILLSYEPSRTTIFVINDVVVVVVVVVWLLLLLKFASAVAVAAAPVGGDVATGAVTFSIDVVAVAVVIATVSLAHGDDDCYKFSFCILLYCSPFR